MVMQKAETNSKVKRALPQGLLQVTFLTAKPGPPWFYALLQQANNQISESRKNIMS
jgi:hypothetical protein